MPSERKPDIQNLMRRDRQAARKNRLSDLDRDRSAERLSQRQTIARALDVSVNADLPVAEAAEKIRSALREHQVVIVAGETGSGKTTQLPKICLDLGFGVAGFIGHTQPRRLAARTVAQRVDQELGGPTGTAAHAIRFSDRVGDATLVKVMTDGLLLTEIRRDRFLDAYDVIIIDEAHERSLNIDFLLGYLRGLTKKRKDLKIIVTSATIDVERFSTFFHGAPIIEVSGRTYPVRVEYLDEPLDLVDAVRLALEDIETRPHQGASDVLAFFSGEREIFEVSKALRDLVGAHWELLPLYARLSYQEQRKIFQPTSAKRRLVLATNVAETSITVPNIGFVIDPGFARINRYSYRSKLQRLPIEPIAQASAEQRKGRCGRIAPGVCFRLYSEEDYLSRAAFTDPEIRRVNLASVVLQMQAFGLGNIQTFPFIDPPDPRAIKDALRLLDELKALAGGRLTKLGRAMARLPVDPRLARMLVEANQQGALSEVLVIVAGLAVQDPRERPLKAQQAADASHVQFGDPKSDFMAWLNLWRWIEEERQALTRNRFARLLSKRFINPIRVREWREVHRQLRLACRDLGFRENEKPASYGAIHEAIISGCLSLIALHDEKGAYQGARNLKLRKFPGSSVENNPRWLVAAEIAETSRVYARNVAQVEAGWIERQAQHLLKKHHSAPRWSQRRGEVVANQSVALYGLRLAENRVVGFHREDPDQCYELFLREGLIAGAIKDPPEFLRANLMEIARIRDLEAKGRRRDLMVDESEIYEFYAERIPRSICRVSDLKAWLNNRANTALFMDQGFLERQRDQRLTVEAFPDHLALDGVELPLKYRFAPGEQDDGVTLTVPVGLLPVLSAERLEWFVPGLLPNVIEQWIRSLPKQKRKQLAPLPEKVDSLCAHLLKVDNFGVGRLRTALALLLKDWYRVEVLEEDWSRERLDPHLLMYLKVIDEQGSVVATGRDLPEIRNRLGGADQLVAQEQVLRPQVISHYPCEGLADYVMIGEGSARKLCYPGLRDRGDAVELVLFDTSSERDRQNRFGLSRLALLDLGHAGRYFKKELDKHPALQLQFAPLGNAQDLKNELLLNVVWYCFFEGRPLPSDIEAFNDRLETERPALAGVFNQAVSVFAEIMALRQQISSKLLQLSSAAYEPVRKDVTAQLDVLAGPNILSATPYALIPLLPRYLQGLLYRLENLVGRVPKDLALMREIHPLENRIEAFPTQELYDEERMVVLRFLLHELRLSMFAGQMPRRNPDRHPLDDSFLGPRWKASGKRVEREITVEEQRLGLR